MRKNGIENPYEKLKDLTRGSEIITQEVLRNFIEGLDIPAEDKTRLLTMSPQNYIGIAAILAKKS
jgi:adenylosuccinate lyase